MYQTTKAKVVMTSIEVALNCKGTKICKYGHDSCTDAIKQALAMGMYTWLSGLGGYIEEIGMDNERSSAKQKLL